MSKEKKVNDLGIDVETRTKRRLIARLAKLKTTTSVEDGGEYRQDRSYSIVYVSTTKTEEELDDWLYNTKDDIEYVGVFQR